jgi:general secretion pathway protein L
MQIRATPDLNVRGLWSWWISELSSLVPETDPRRDASRKTRAEVCVTSDKIELYRRQRLFNPLVERRLVGATPVDQLQTLPLRPGETVALTFDLGTCFRRNQALPVSARSKINDILDYQATDLNPHPANRPLGFYKVTGGGDALQVDHALLRRDVADKVIESLKQAKVRVTCVGVRDGLSPAWSVLRHADGTAYGEAVEKKWRRRAAAAACFLLAMVAAVGFVGWNRQANAVAQARDEAELLQPAAVKVRKSLEELGASNDLTKAAIEAKASATDVPRILDQLTKIMPDHTWVQNIAIRGKVIQMDGLSGDAEALIQTLETSPSFSNVRFSAPVYKNPADNRVHYSIAADLEAGKE